MNHPNRSLLTFALGLVLSTLLVPLVALGQSPGEAPLSPAATSGLGAYFLVHNDPALTELAPAVAYNSVRREFLVVWYNDRPGNDDIRAQRLAADGRLLGGPFYIAAGAGAERSVPDVAYCEKQDQYLVVWQHYEAASGTSIHGRRLSGTGLVLDPADIVIASPGYNLYTPADPAVAYAYTSDKYLVVWSETWHPLPITRDIVGQVVAPNGTLGAAITVADDTTGNYCERPALAYNRGRNEYLVAWQQDTGSSHWGIYGRRVTGDGALLFPASTTIFWTTISAAAPSVAAMATAGTDGQYYVAFQVQYTATDLNIYARYVRADGTVLSGAYVASAGVDEAQTAVAGSESGGTFLATWKRDADPPLAFTYAYARAVPPEGGTLGAEQYAGGLIAAHPAVAAGLGGDFLVVFEDTPLMATSAGVYARLFGQRTYVPMTLRNYH